ncbi:MAG: prefoldin subunit alpha [Candidatus Heimdallarchaeota archaeon]|nr:prefoldin subunit alpha [Candidatus Heimdallarchaeota archaeon]
MQSDQSSLNEYYSQYQSTVNQLKALTTQQSQVFTAIQELEHNITTIVGLQSKRESQDVMIPMGGILHVKAELIDSEKILVNIGSDVIVPLKYDEAKSYIETRVVEMREINNRMNDDMVRLEGLASQLQSQMDQFQKE